jgi:hypothetical protein
VLDDDALARVDDRTEEFVGQLRYLTLGGSCDADVEAAPRGYGELLRDRRPVRPQKSGRDPSAKYDSLSGAGLGPSIEAPYPEPSHHIVRSTNSGFGEMISVENAAAAMPGMSLT